MLGQEVERGLHSDWADYPSRSTLPRLQGGAAVGSRQYLRLGFEAFLLVCSACILLRIIDIACAYSTVLGNVPRWPLGRATALTVSNQKNQDLLTFLLYNEGQNVQQLVDLFSLGVKQYVQSWLARLILCLVMVQYMLSSYIYCNFFDFSRRILNLFPRVEEGHSLSRVNLVFS